MLIINSQTKYTCMKLFEFKFLIDSGDKHFVRYMYCRYFLPVCNFSFNVLNSILLSRNFKFWLSIIYNLFPLKVQSKKSLFTVNSWTYSSMFSSRNLLVSDSIFRVVIHLELILCIMWIRSWVCLVQCDLLLFQKSYHLQFLLAFVFKFCLESTIITSHRVF